LILLKNTNKELTLTLLRSKVLEDAELFRIIENIGNIMNTQETLDRFLDAYKAYYNITTEDVLEPFAATAVFSIHNEQYMLVKMAKYAEINSNEYVYFYTGQSIDLNRLNEIDNKAWEDGMSKVVPDSTHRNSDVTLIILCEDIADDVKKAMKKMRHYKSYALGLKGWSNFRLVVVECSSGELILNSQGHQLKKLVSNIIKHDKGERS